MKKERDLTPTRIDGIEYYSVGQFAELTHKAAQTIFTLIIAGNRFRRLNVLRIAGKPLIPISELTEYPFTLPGKSQEVYRYDSSGQQIPKERLGDPNDY